MNNTLYAYKSKVKEANSTQKHNNQLLAELRSITDERDALRRDMEKKENAAEEGRLEMEK